MFERNRTRFIYLLYQLLPIIVKSCTKVDIVVAFLTERRIEPHRILIYDFPIKRDNKSYKINIKIELQFKNTSQKLLFFLII